MNDWINTLLQGLMLGGLYALFATGLSLSFGIMRLVNIAHGDLIVLGGYVAWFATRPLTALGPVAPWLGFVAAVPAMALLTYGLQRVLLDRMLGQGLMPPLLVTFGLSIVAQNAMLMLFSPDVRSIDTGPLATASVDLGGTVAVGVLPLAVTVVAVTVITALQWLLRGTALGRAFRAASDDPVTAQLMGIDRKHLYGLALALSGAVVAAAGVFLAMRTTISPTDGPARLIYAFEAVIIGGLGSLWGTLAGGAILGVAQALGAALNPGWGILAGHLVFLAVLMLRPEGLFPRTRDR